MKKDVKLFVLKMLAFSLSVFADENVEELKKQIQQQQETVKQLEEKIKQIELERANNPYTGIISRTAQQAQQRRVFLTPTERILANPFAQPRMLPDLSLIVDFSYVSRNLTDKTYQDGFQPGFNHGLLHRHHHNIHNPYNMERGFNLNYTELWMSQAVDPYFDLVGVFHFAGESVEVEEGYFRTRSLPFNLQVKGGKFYSKIGRLNEQHHHYWDFVDAPLIYWALFGDHNLLEKGLQVTWLAPTPFFLMLGGEVFQGDNENNFNRNGFTVNTKKDGSGQNIEVPDTKKPNLYTLFTKASFDLNNKTTILAGLSYMKGGTRIDHTEDHNPHALRGTTEIYGVDLTLRHNLDSYRYITWQSEYFNRKFDGIRYGYNPGGELVSRKLERDQAGFYSQVVYKFDFRWRVGFRYDLIHKNDVFVNNTNRNLPDDLNRYSFMLDFLPSEYSRVRLQYSYDRSIFSGEAPNFERRKNHQIIVQFNITVGVHGAHNF